MHIVSQARRPGALIPLAALALVLVALVPVLAAATERTLYPFVAYPSSGTQRTDVFPSGTLVRDATGALFGATSLGGVFYNGTVFKLTPPRPGTTTWTKTVLHTFLYHYGTGDGCNPGAGVIRDATGALYGTTMGGGGATYSQPGFGTVFKLTPPAQGQTSWKETVLYRFAGGADGASPMAELTADGTGALYGTTVYGGTGECHDPMLNVVGCGTVFKLTPPAPGQVAWKESVLHSFHGPEGAFPQGGVIADAAGTLYGTAAGGGQRGVGVVFKLTPPAPGHKGWTAKVLHHFNVSTSGDTPLGELVANPAGQLFGVAHGGGPGRHGVRSHALVPQW